MIREVIPVILGILIALVINNWNEDRKDKKYLSQIFSSLESELEESRAGIEESYPKQQMLLDTIGKYMNDETVSLFEIMSKGGGINGANIKNGAWRAIANSKIELIDFEKLSMLTEIDESKEGLKLKQEKLLGFMVDNLKSTNREKKEVFMLLNQDILSSFKYAHFEIEEYLKLSGVERNKSLEGPTANINE